VGLGYETPISDAAIPPSGDEPESFSIILRASDESEIEIPYTGNLRPHIRMGVIGVEPGSALAQAFPHFMVRPILSRTSKLVMELTPSNIDNICQTPISYVDGVDSLGHGSGTYKRWITHMIPRIMTENYDATHTPASEIVTQGVDGYGFVFMTPYEQLPYDLVIGPIIEHVESRSSARRFANSGLELSDLKFENCNDLSIFPNIVYSIYNHHNSQFDKQVDIVLYPEDYAEIISESSGESSCVAHIRSTDDQYESGIIGSNIVRAINTHFDSTNGKIGFCDTAI
jgi:hypothetical protein